MSKFCRSCGHALEEGATACPACGKSTSREIAPAKKNNNDVLNKISEVILVIFCLIEKLLLLLVAKIGEAIKTAKENKANGEGAQPATLQNDSKPNYIRIGIVAVLIVLALIASIMNFTLKYEVNAKATMSFGDQEMTGEESGPIGELLESDVKVAMLPVISIVWGVFNLVIIALGVLLILKALKLTNTDKKFKGLTLTGLIGDGVYLILYLIFRTVSESEGGMSVKMSVGIHFFVWIHIVVFALAYASTYLNLNALVAGKAENTAE